MKPLLEIKNLYVTYNSNDENVKAVNGVSLTVGQGETLGLVGETGAGKTTAALSIMRLLPERTGRIEHGDILFEGESLLGLKEKDMQRIRGEKISMIFQDPMTSLNPVLTIGDQILEGLELHNTEGKSRDDMMKRVSEMLELVGIPAKRYNEYPHQFSGGMKQRVVIAMALACNPSLLIADEPTTALDVTIQAQVLEMMGELKKSFHMAMILITHDLGIVAETCDSVAAVYAGEIIEYGTAEDIYEAGEHHPYTTGLFGAIPSLTSQERRLHSIDGLMPDPTNLPPGCKFHPRCPKCMDICRGKEPEMIRMGPTHFIRCHLFAGASGKNGEEAL